MKTIKTTTTINNTNTIYLQKAIRKALNLDNGDKVSLEVVDGALVIKPCLDVADWAVNYLFLHDLRNPTSYKIGRDRLAGITTVILPDGNVGVAQCSPNDAFDDVVGEAIALARALGEDRGNPRRSLRIRKKGEEILPFFFRKK